MKSEPKVSTRWIKRLGGVAGLAGVLVLLRTVDVPRALLGFVDWVRQAGLVGVVSFGAVYLVAAVTLLPASILTLGAGFAWGPFLGLAVVLPSATVAATVSFLLGRTLARPWVQRRAAQSPRFRALDEAVASGGFRLVLLLRLSPVFPFNVLNYLLGLTRVSARDYVLGTAIGMVPGTFLYLYLGSLVTSVTELASGSRPSGGPFGAALSAVGLLATLAVTVWVTRTARTALSKILTETKDFTP